jgi:hypothetical protein
MNTRIRIVVVIVALCTLLAALGCGFGELSGSLHTPTPAVPVGDFECSIPVTLVGANDIVILGFTITPEQEIGNWTIFDFGTGRISIGYGFGQSSLNGNAVQFTLTDSSNGITYEINGTIASARKMTGDYNFDYGSRLGVAAGQFDCDLTPPAEQTTPAP